MLIKNGVGKTYPILLILKSKKRNMANQDSFMDKDYEDMSTVKSGKITNIEKIEVGDKSSAKIIFTVDTETGNTLKISQTSAGKKTWWYEEYMPNTGVSQVLRYYNAKTLRELLNKTVAISLCDEGYYGIYVGVDNV